MLRPARHGTPPCPTAAPASTSASQGGRIAAVEPGLAGAGRARRSTPAGCLVSPPFVDSAFPHGRDAVATACRASTSRGTLLEGIALWGELKPLLTHEARRRARAAPIATGRSRMGLLAIRSHVDICDDRLLAVEALLEVQAARRALPRPAARRLPAGRPAAARPARVDNLEARARPGRRRRRRHPAFRAHDGRRRRVA